MEIYITLYKDKADLLKMVCDYDNNQILIFMNKYLNTNLKNIVRC